MSYEESQLHSEYWGASEQALEMIGEIAVLPVEILGSLATEAFDLDSE